MDRPMEGIKVLEVAQFTFVPAAGAVLADWGADIIKVEHAVTGDAQRGLVRVFGAAASREGSSFSPVMEGPNRGKRSIGLALEKPETRWILEALVKESDVFMTNFLPGAQRRLGIDVDSIRTVNPDIIYVTGSGFGTEGSEAEKGGYDATAFWARGGSAYGSTSPDADYPTFMPAGGYGDSLGGLTIAGGVAAALFARANTGRPSTVDVSLLAMGAWATQFSVKQALFNNGPIPQFDSRTASVGNPLVGNYQTSDARWIQLCMLQPGRYWSEFVTAAGRPDLVTNERFTTAESIMANYPAAVKLVGDIIAGKTAAEWVEVLSAIEGQWALMQTPWEIANDDALIANGRIVEVVDADGRAQRIVGNPVKFDNAPVRTTRAPQFAEHTDEILRELGTDDEALIELKIAGAIT